MTVHENIRKYRKEKNLTQKQLGNLCNPKIEEANIRKYELGKANPKVETLERIAAALEIPVTDLLFEKGTTVAQISDGYSNKYVNVNEIGKDTIAILDSSPVIAKMTTQEIDEVFEVFNKIYQSVADELPEPEIMKQYKKLNSAGKQKALDYTTDLTLIEKYQKEPEDKK